MEYHSGPYVWYIFEDGDIVLDHADFQVFFPPKLTNEWVPKDIEYWVDNIWVKTIH